MRRRTLRFVTAIPSALLLWLSVTQGVGAASEVCGAGGMVVSASAPASAVGAEVLGRGGNAIDAAVAVGFALAVTYPQAGNIGGGGFLLARLETGERVFIDFRECAPLAASRDMYLDSLGEVVKNASLIGHLASGVPGSVAGLAEAHRRYGSLPWRELVEPAIALARDGFPVTASQAGSLRNLASYRGRFPGLAAFARPDGTLLEAGDTLRQPDLARTLRSIAEGGEDAFYRGAIAELIVAEMRAGGGIMTREDLAGYRPRIREPVRGSYRGYEVISAPPPSSGGVILLEVLNIIEGYDMAASGPRSDESVHRLVEAERRAYLDRSLYLGDPDFWSNPVEMLLSKERSAELRSSIGRTATSSSALGAAAAADREKRETTHYSIVDASGNAVAVTTTLNDSYGSRVVVRGGGFLLNNEMDDFSIRPGVPNLYGLVGGEANAIAPRKRMLSSMAPTILLKDGRVVLVVGTPGGGTIITTIAQVIVDMIDYGMSLEEAVNAPRYHHQWLPDRISAERDAFPPALEEALRARGHSIETRKEPIGSVQAIWCNNGAACGVSDPRGDGAAVAGGAGARPAR